MTDWEGAERAEMRDHASQQRSEVIVKRLRAILKISPGLASVGEYDALLKKAVAMAREIERLANEIERGEL
jgi:hypothetical protein